MDEYTLKTRVGISLVTTCLFLAQKLCVRVFCVCFLRQVPGVAVRHVLANPCRRYSFLPGIYVCMYLVLPSAFGAFVTTPPFSRVQASVFVYLGDQMRLIVAGQVPTAPADRELFFQDVSLLLQALLGLAVGEDQVRACVRNFSVNCWLLS